MIFMAGILGPALSTTAGAQEEEKEQPLSDFDTLKSSFEEAYKAGDYDKAIAIGKEMNGIIEPRHWETLYNIGCAYAKAGEKGKAYEYLQKAVDANYMYAHGLMTDEDLESLRGEKRFKQLVRAAWKNGYVWILERDERAEYQQLPRIMETLGLQKGERVADIGCGTGYFTIPVARAVGPEGKVLAIDASQEMLDYLERRITAEQLENVELKKVGRDDPELPDGGIELILMVDTYHYIKERTEYGKKLLAGLAPGGRLVVIDFRPKPWEERPWGPPPEQKMSKEELTADLEKAGFKLVEDHDFLTEQFFVVYEAE
jgi:SAM-dependent methyltransferase